VIDAIMIAICKTYKIVAFRFLY